MLHHETRLARGPALAGLLALCLLGGSALAQDATSANYRFDLIDAVSGAAPFGSTNRIGAVAVQPVAGTLSSSGYHLDLGQLGGYGLSLGSGPQVIAVTPSVGSCAGGEVIRVIGYNFDELGAGSSLFIRLGIAPAFHPTVISNTEIVLITPPGTPGDSDVTVSTTYGQKAMLAGFHYQCPSGPPVAAFTITPNEGDVDGGLLVTVTGLSLVPGTLITFDGVPATDLQYVNDQTLRCHTPAHAPGNSTPTVSNGLGAASIPGGFLYRTHASVTNLGGGCSGHFGAPQHFVGGALPVIGGAQFGAVLANAEHNTAAALLVSGPVASPLTIAPCVAWVDPFNFFQFPVVTSPVGTALIWFQLPNDPIYEGLVVHTQWLVIDGFGALDLALSNALRLRLGY